MQNPRKTKKHADGSITLEALSYRYAERFKFDFFLDNETTVSEFVTNEILAAINGYQYIVDGIYHVGVQRPGLFPCWLFNEGNVDEGSVSVAFQGRGAGLNRVRVQYTNVRDEYRKDFAESNNEFDQRARYKVQAATLVLNGISRHGHASAIADTVLAQVHASRRSVGLKTHYLGLVFSPGDCIEVSHVGCGVNRLKTRLVSLQEDEEGKVKLSAQEHKPLLSILRDADTSNPNDPGESVPTAPTEPGFCESAVGGTGGGIVWFNGGAAYSPGTYFVYYIGGAYKLNPSGGYVVEGYDVVTRDGAGNLAVIAPAPAADDPPGGHGSAAAAISASTGEYSVIAMPINGPIGIRLHSGAAYTNFGPDGNPEYDLCTRTRDCAGDDCGPCADGCTEPANTGPFYISEDSVLNVSFSIALNGASALAPAADSVDLSNTARNATGATWHHDFAAGDFVEVEFNALTKRAYLVYSRNGGSWRFAGPFAFDGQAVPLDAEGSIWSNRAVGSPSGQAMLSLKSNPNPKDGRDCLSARGCGATTRHVICNYSVTARHLDDTVVYFNDGVSFAAGTYTIRWVKGVIRFSDDQGYRLVSTSTHRYYVRYISAGVEVDLELKPDGEVQFPTDFDAQTAYSQLPTTDLQVTITADRGQIGVVLIDSPYNDNSVGPQVGAPVFELCSSLLGDPGGGGGIVTASVLYSAPEYFGGIGGAFPAGEYVVTYLGGTLTFSNLSDPVNYFLHLGFFGALSHYQGVVYTIDESTVLSNFIPRPADTFGDPDDIAVQSYLLGLSKFTKTEPITLTELSRVGISLFDLGSEPYLGNAAGPSTGAPKFKLERMSPQNGICADSGDLDSCPARRTFALSGLDGAAAAYNGEHTFTVTEGVVPVADDGDFGLQLTCNSDGRWVWRVDIVSLSAFFIFEATGLGDLCPPVDGNSFIWRRSSEGYGDNVVFTLVDD
jgi:hypothetical protein